MDTGKSKGYLHLNRPPLLKMDSLSSKSSVTCNLPTTPVKDYRDMQEAQATSDKISLPVFLSRHHKDFPVRIRVCKGFCGSDEESSISDGDQFNVHFIKYTTIIAIEYENGSRFNVPLNSAIPFAILYNPHNNLNDAMTGYKFEKVSDILQMATLPTLLWARRAYQGSTSDSSVLANELLIVRKVRSKILGSKSLKVYSLTTSKDKVLSANCAGNFSTKPRDVCLYLPEILKHMPDIFPCQAVLFNQADSAPRKSGHQRTGSNSKLGVPVHVTMLLSSVETSLVATSIHDQDPENARLLDLPITLDILVRTEENVNEDETQRLYEDTSFIYEHFNPANVQPMMKENTNKRTQSQFYTNVCFGQERSGVDVAKPPMIQTEGIYQTPRPVRTSSDPVPIESVYHPPMTNSPGGSGSGLVGQAASPTDGNVWRPPLPPPRKASDAARKRSENYAYVDTHPRTTRPVDQPAHRRAPAGPSEQVSPLSRSLPDAHVTDMSSFGSTGSGGACVASRRGSAGGKPSSNSDSGVVEAAKRVAILSSGFPINETPPVQRQVSAPLPQAKTDNRPDSIMFTNMLEDLDQMSKELESCLVVENDDNSSSGISDGSTSSGESGDGAVHSTDKAGSPITPDTIERNKRFLRSMDNTQILKLLEAMDLTQYIEEFRQQHINGDILSELDSEILQNELGVKSRLHRIRLQKVISGQYSVTELMAAKTEYVFMQPS